jgi:signal peptidase I
MNKPSYQSADQRALASGLLSCESEAFAQLSTDLLRKGVGIKFQAFGGSMRPLIRNGEVVLVKQVNPQDVKLGDALLFVNESGKAVLHRVIKIKKSTQKLSFMMQGDHSSRPDGWMSEKLILGKLMMVERNGAQIWMDQPLMRFLGRLVVLESKLSLRQTWLGQCAIFLLRRCPALRAHLVQEV